MLRFSNSPVKLNDGAYSIFALLIDNIRQVIMFSVDSMYLEISFSTLIKYYETYLDDSLECSIENILKMYDSYTLVYEDNITCYYEDESIIQKLKDLKKEADFNVKMKILQNNQIFP